MRLSDYLSDCWSLTAGHCGSLRVRRVTTGHYGSRRVTMGHYGSGLQCVRSSILCSDPLQNLYFSDLMFQSLFASFVAAQCFNAVEWRILLLCSQPLASGRHRCLCKTVISDKAPTHLSAATSALPLGLLSHCWLLPYFPALPSGPLFPMFLLTCFIRQVGSLAGLRQLCNLRAAFLGPIHYSFLPFFHALPSGPLAFQVLLPSLRVLLRLASLCQLCCC